MPSPFFLVVGSVREGNYSAAPLVGVVQGNNVDLTHLNSFDGKAITMDLSPSQTEGAPHIIGDARTYNLGDSEIKHVLLERLPTCVIPQVIIGGPGFSGPDRRVPLEDAMGKNYIGDCVENLSKFMKSGAILEIEWSPDSALGGITMNNKDRETQIANSNPFHGFHDYNVVTNSFGYAGGERHHANPQAFLDIFMPVAHKVIEDLTFYQSLGCGEDFDELAQMCRQEGYRIRMLTIGTASGGAERIVLQCDMLKDDVKTITDAGFGPSLYPNPLPPTGQKVGLQDSAGGPVKLAYIHSINTFLPSTFFHFVISSIAAERNKPRVIAYLESVGFKDVTVERRTNEHNGRQNVWMVRAVKV